MARHARRQRQPGAEWAVKRRAEVAGVVGLDWTGVVDAGELLDLLGRR